MTQNQSEWKAVFDSVKGTSHEVSDQPCQDCCRVVAQPSPNGGVLIAVCADGAGSAKHSDQGSQIACNQFIKLCRNYIIENESIQDVNHELISDWLQQVRDSIAEKAEEIETSVRQMATTLLGCIITSSEALFVQIGDGAMVFRSKGNFECAFWPHTGEYANMTNFLTSDDFAEKFEWKIVIDQISEFVAFTDGLERLVLKFENQSVHEPAIAPMLDALRKSDNGEEFFEPLRGFLNSKGVNERTDDDKTLILATRLENDEAVV